MSPETTDSEVTIRGFDRFLAFAALIIVVLSVVCFFSIIIGTATGMKHQDFAHGVWPIVAAVPSWGLPVGFACIITLLVTSFIRKGRAAKRAR